MIGQRPPPLTDTQVYAILQAMVAGTPDIVLARAYGKNAETMRRIRRGETHTHITVPGDEALRPNLWRKGGVVAVPGRAMTLEVPPSTKEEAEAAEAEAQEIIQWAEERKKAKAAGLPPPPEKEKVLTPNEALDKFFGGGAQRIGEG